VRTAQTRQANTSAYKQSENRSYAARNLALHWEGIPHLLSDVCQKCVVRHMPDRRCAVNGLLEEVTQLAAPWIPSFRLGRTAFCAARTTASAIFALISWMRSRRRYTGFDSWDMIGHVLCVAIASTTCFVNAFCRHRNSPRVTMILTRIVLKPRSAVGFT
jgi:hypothetical protein